MHFFVKKVEEAVRRGGLLAPGECCVVAVSGGPDSMALFHAMAQLAPSLGISLVVAHVDHGLRPSEAGAEARLVREAAQGLGLACECGKVDVIAYAKEQGLSREHAARNLRYEFLGEVAARHRAVKIAVAHTADDQAEEILLRLIRGSGRAGLTGMAQLRDGLVIRPLLGITKEEVLGYLAEEDIPYCLDSSNHQRIYLRNRIRLDLLPYLQTHFNPNIGNSLRETAAIFSAEEELLSGMTSHAYAKVVAAEGGEPGGLTIQVANFLSQPLAIRRRILESACWRMGCRPSFRQIAQLLSLIETGPEGAGLHLPRGLRVVKAEGRVRFRYPQGRQAVRGNLEGAGAAISFSRELPGPGEYFLEDIGSMLMLRLLDALPIGWEAQVPTAVFCDAGKVFFPLVARSFREGDRFHPLGAPGSKKVGDFFTDQKIPLAQRNRIPILADQEGIVAILGMRPDQRAAISPSTRRILAVSLHPLATGENGFTEKAIHGK